MFNGSEHRESSAPAGPGPLHPLLCVLVKMKITPFVCNNKIVALAAGDCLKPDQLVSIVGERTKNGHILSSTVEYCQQ